MCAVALLGRAHARVLDRIHRAHAFACGRSSSGCRALPRPRRVLARDHRADARRFLRPRGRQRGEPAARGDHDTGSTPSADPFTLWRRYERARRADRRGADRRDHRRPDAERRAHVDEYVSTERADLRRARRGHALGDRGARAWRSALVAGDLRAEQGGAPTGWRGASEPALDLSRLGAPTAVIRARILLAGHAPDACSRGNDNDRAANHDADRTDNDHGTEPDFRGSAWPHRRSVVDDACRAIDHTGPQRTSDQGK